MTPLILHLRVLAMIYPSESRSCVHVRASFVWVNHGHVIRRNADAILCPLCVLDASESVSGAPRYMTLPICTECTAPADRKLHGRLSGPGKVSGTDAATGRYRNARGTRPSYAAAWMIVDIGSVTNLHGICSLWHSRRMRSDSRVCNARKGVADAGTMGR